MAKLPKVDVSLDTFALKGGLDLHTPTLSLKPGFARSAQNWECSVNGGYSRIAGYERFDGRPSPTAGVYTALIVEQAATNLVLQSETLGTTWAPGNVTISSDAIAAPDGTVTADKLVETAVTGYHYVQQSVTFVAGNTYTLSVYAKAGERTILGLQASGWANPDNRGINFNLATGQIGTPYNGGLVSDATMTAVGNGWYRCSVTYLCDASGSAVVFAFAKVTDDTAQHLGVVGSGLYVWGAQVEVATTPSTYAPTTTVASGTVPTVGATVTGRTSAATAVVAYIDGSTLAVTKLTGTFLAGEKLRIGSAVCSHVKSVGGQIGPLTVSRPVMNLVLRSQELDNATWTPVGLNAVSPNAVAAPDGTMTADFISESVGGTFHYTRGNAITNLATTTYTASVYVKGSQRNLGLWLRNADDSANYATAAFTATGSGTISSAAGTAGTGYSAASATIVAIGDGWYRCTLTATIDVAVTSIRPTLRLNQGVSTSYSGDGTSGVYLWGCQVEVGATANTYAPTTTVASGAPIWPSLTITGATSGATAKVGSYSGTALQYTEPVGTFVAGEMLLIGSSVVATIGSVGALTSITDQVTIATYTKAAGDIYRSDIGAVGGASCAGQVRGVFLLSGVVYAWRDNASLSAATLWKATAGGWVQIAFKNELAFTAGSGTAPAEGATVTKGAVSAVVRRVVLESGTWAGGTAAGRLIIDNPTGGNFSAGAFTAGITATCSGVQTSISFNPGGRFEVVTGSVGNGVRAYGADGQNRGWEFDGTTLVPINTGMSPDHPLHVCLHKNYLWFSFAASAQHSGLGTPYQWTVLSGAAEIAVNEDITGFLVMPGSSGTAALAILSDDCVSILYGTTNADFNLTELNLGVGCVAHAAQSLNQSYLYSQLGVMSLQTVQEYGNFSGSSLTLNLRNFVQARRTLVTDSLINHEKSQYRVFFSDGYGLWCTIINGQFFGAMPVLFPNPVACACTGAAVNGSEVSYFGSTNGMVYRLDTGTSFDGAVIDYSLELNFASQGNARVRKRYRKAVLEVQGSQFVQFNAGYSLAYGVEDIVETVQSTTTAGVYWDQFTWDQFNWDGRAISPNYLSLEGSAENISVRIDGSSALWPTFTVNSITLHYTPRRLIR